MEQKIAYELHPVSPERKADLRAQGYKIIDARFAPKDHATESSKQDGEKSLTVAELREALVERDIEFDPKAKKAELQALLDASEQDGKGKE
ncbi:MAG TPA: HeH/LEM domain-containing protein [Burkholderiaceae bacterium]|nr:HeH/LEM domain-containing protein [Burkholderiaceae bacterium]